MWAKQWTDICNLCVGRSTRDAQHQGSPHSAHVAVSAKRYTPLPDVPPLPLDAMGHGANDKLFITPSEYSGVYGQHGATTGARRETSVVVPFHMCALTHQPWLQPACLDDGLVYEKANLDAFLDQYGVNPATGTPVEKNSVIPLTFSKNERGQFFDPVSCREFTDHSHLVAIRPSGNVFLYDTVQQLNLKPKMMRDLVTDEPFTKADLLTLQDPHDPAKRTMQNMYRTYFCQRANADVQNHLTLSQRSQGDDVNAAATGSTKTLLQAIRQKQEEREASLPPKESAPAVAAASSTPRLSNRSTGMTAASFTSSSLTPRTRTERIAIDEEELMFEQVAATATAKKEKALVRLQTNFGPLNLELYVDKAPRTCYNFITLCRQGKYTDTIFHRNVPGFMIQGGDPTGTGRGGQSIWGKPFPDELCNPGSYRHTGRGILSMANKGYNTNGSQFFLTYRATPHLDPKHTVFGRLLSDSDTSEKFKVLDALERVPNEPDSRRPMRPIKLVEAQVFDDPFQRYMERRDARFRRENPDDDERMRREAKRRKRDEDRTTWYVMHKVRS